MEACNDFRASAELIDQALLRTHIRMRAIAEDRRLDAVGTREAMDRERSVLTKLNGVKNAALGVPRC